MSESTTPAPESATPGAPRLVSTLTSSVGPEVTLDLYARGEPRAAFHLVLVAASGQAVPFFGDRVQARHLAEHLMLTAGYDADEVRYAFGGFALFVGSNPSSKPDSCGLAEELLILEGYSIDDARRALDEVDREAKAGAKAGGRREWECADDPSCATLIEPEGFELIVGHRCGERTWHSVKQAREMIAHMEALCTEIEGKAAAQGLADRAPLGAPGTLERIDRLEAEVERLRLVEGRVVTLEAAMGVSAAGRAMGAAADDVRAYAQAIDDLSDLDATRRTVAAHAKAFGELSKEIGAEIRERLDLGKDVTDEELGHLRDWINGPARDHLEEQRAQASDEARERLDLGEKTKTEEDLEAVKAPGCLCRGSKPAPGELHDIWCPVRRNAGPGASRAVGRLDGELRVTTARELPEFMAGDVRRVLAEWNRLTGGVGRELGRELRQALLDAPEGYVVRIVPPGDEDDASETSRNFLRAGHEAVLAVPMARRIMAAWGTGSGRRGATWQAAIDLSDALAAAPDSYGVWIAPTEKIGDQSPSDD